ncbi:hypothetical protein [Shewanella sp. CG12_big_fil_rev_8_21_14_0_65_47_15]|uniref:hypothetical protein n=1 Tax=Shewanella sp. CG12_big_fil_rev_8_21_14_0_65_47_15 TaxID=1975537 RepID=UPI000CACF663|nr:hypothetical protein [Shewanella sp. CG12_big_fil_rev_8_21_14_0_65_47_15]PIW62578.1 MAG: hypothetical protein COW15_02720 [Shewanella sp. CG12_big_fil_rev_8_21_14_0_65_47_15]
MRQAKNEEMVSFFPKKQAMIVFLIVTLLLLIGTGMSVTIVLNTYYKLSAEWSLAILMVLSLLFSFINFKVTRGSFSCANLLKYYTVLLVLIGIPAVLLQDTFAKQLFCLFNLAVLIATFFLVKSKIYHAYIQHQFDLINDIKEAQAIIEKEINRGRSRQ